MESTEKRSTEPNSQNAARAKDPVIDTAGLDALLERLLHGNVGDFRNYKRSSLERRVSQRLSQLGISTCSEYIGFLEADSSEFSKLHSTLTVKVSEFFRDPLCFTIIAELLKNEFSSSDKGLRAWCCACATGEEAYSLAILLTEHLSTAGAAASRIFATDVDSGALESARCGEYRTEYMNNVTGDHKERYFSGDGKNSKANENLRNMIRFGKLDIVTGHAFSKIDIIFCRNLFIYFNKRLQLDVFAKLHYALAPGGLLLLGKAEVIPFSYTSFYTRIEKAGGVYRKRRFGK